MADPPSSSRMMNFVSEQQLEESRKRRGERVEDGTAQRDRPLYEILKENKDKRDAEFNERFKHRPPKALDDDETEFLDRLETSRRKYEQQVADDEAQQLLTFQEAVAVRASVVHEMRDPPPKVQEQKAAVKKTLPSKPSGPTLMIKPLPKKQKTQAVETRSTESSVRQLENNPDLNPSSMIKTQGSDVDDIDHTNGALGGLVSYSDESEDDDS